MLECSEQSVIIALVQTDTRFVENVQHADQPRANLRCQPYSLRFAAGKRTGRPRQCQIIQPHVNQKTEPRMQFFHNLLGNKLLPLGEVYIAEKFISFGNRHIGNFPDIFAADGNCQNLRL